MQAIVRFGSFVLTSNACAGARKDMTMTAMTAAEVKADEVHYYEHALGIFYCARRDSAEHFFRSNALHCTATARVLIPAECSAIS